MRAVGPLWVRFYVFDRFGLFGLGVKTPVPIRRAGVVTSSALKRLARQGSFEHPVNGDIRLACDPQNMSRTKQASTYLSPFAGPLAGAAGFVGLVALVGGSLLSFLYPHQRALVLGAILIQGAAAIALALAAIYYRARADDLAAARAEALKELYEAKKHAELLAANQTTHDMLDKIAQAIAGHRKSWLPWRR